MNRRIIGIVVAVLLAATGTFVLVAWVQSAEDRVLAGEETVDVLVVRDEVARGTKAEDVDAQLELERVPSKVKAAGSVDSLEDLDGQVTAVDLLPGEQVLASRFVEPETLAQLSRVDVPDELQEVTVSLSPERAVGGQLVPGATVGLFASFDPFDVEDVALETGEEIEAEEADGGKKTPNTTHLILHKVLVTNVQGDPAATDDGDEEEQDDAPGRDPAPGNNLLVTLALDPAEAERVVFTAEFGHIWLSNQPEDADEDGTGIQHRGTVYAE